MRSAIMFAMFCLFVSACDHRSVTTTADAMPAPDLGPARSDMLSADALRTDLPTADAVPRDERHIAEPDKGVSPGPISVGVDNVTPLADVAVSGTWPVGFATYRITARNEAITLVGAVVHTTHKHDVAKVALVYKNKASTTVWREGYPDSNGDFIFPDGALDMYIGKGKSELLTVNAYLNTIANGAVSGDGVKLGLKKVASQWAAGSTLTNGFVALGESSNVKLYGAADNISVDNTKLAFQVVRKTKVLPTESDFGSIAHTTKSQDAVGVFTFKSTAEPNSGQNSTLKSVTVKLSGSLIAIGQGDNQTALSVYSGSAFNAATLMGFGVVTGLDTHGSSIAEIPINAMNYWSGDKQVYFVVNSTDSDFVDSANSIEKLTLHLIKYKWFDGVADAELFPVIGVSAMYGKTYLY